MKESLVTSRQLCEQLKDAGMEQSGWEFYWVNIGHPQGRAKWKVLSRSKPTKVYPNIAGHPDWAIYAAPLAGELMELLPYNYWVCREEEKTFPDTLTILLLTLNKDGIMKLDGLRGG